MATFLPIFLLVLIQLLPAPSNAQAISGQCHIERGSSSAVGIPTFNGQSQTTYSCVADENCNYDVHIIGNYEGDYNHGFGPVTSSGTTNVRLSVSGRGSNLKPIVLVFVSYEPVRWILSIPTGVIVEKVLLGSYYLDHSDVTYSRGSVLSVERHGYSTLPTGFGSDTGGGRTDRLLEYVVGRFGPVTSFSGSYRADTWTLNIHRGENYSCPITTIPPPTSSSSSSSSGSVITNTTPPPASSSGSVITTRIPPPTSSSGMCALSSRQSCIGTQEYCPGSYSIGTTCIDGYCRCPNNPDRDYCTCLPISGQCRIKQGSSSAVGIPTFNGQSQITYSCVADENCNYDVHIISNYEGDYNHGFGPVTSSGTTNVRLSVSGQGSNLKPIVLVFVSYEPVRWILSIPTGVIVEKVLLGSYYLDHSDVTYSRGSVLSVERHRYSTLPTGFGSDTGGGRTDRLLEYVVGRFGPVASFSGSYRADAWTLNIHRGEVYRCPFTIPPPPSSSSSSGSVITNRIPPRTSSSSSSSGIVIGIVVGTMGILILLAIIVPVVVVMSVKKNRAANGGTTRHLGHLPSPQQQIFYTQLQQTSIHSSSQPRTGIPTDIYAAISVNTQSTEAAQTPNKPVLSKAHTGELTDSAPPGYDEALNYPVPTAKGSQLPPPYSQ